MAYHAGAELIGHRVLPDQPADQGLQRPGLRVRRQPVRRLPGQRAGGAVRRLRLLVGPDDGRGQAARSNPRAGPIYLKVSHLPDETLDRARGHPAHHRAAHPRHLPRQPRPRLPHPRHRDAHLRDRPVQWAFRVRGVGRRARPHHRARPVRGRRPGLRAAQLHDRRVRLRRPGRRARRVARWPTSQRRRRFRPTSSPPRTS